MTIARDPIFDQSPWANTNVVANLANFPLDWGGIPGSGVLGTGPFLAFGGRIVAITFASFGLVTAGTISCRVQKFDPTAGVSTVIDQDLTAAFSAFPTLLSVRLEEPFEPGSGLEASLTTDAAFTTNPVPFQVQVIASTLYDRGITPDPDLS